MKTVHPISRRSCLALGASALAACVVEPARAETVAKVVVELFTSQGCSSCPPADGLLAEMSTIPGVVSLTFHVDYWDYLGWKDTLGSKDYSQRQYDYAKSRGDMDVYTPQMIVNGTTHMVGNQRSEVLAVIEKSRVAQWHVPMEMTATASEIAVEMEAGKPVGEATLWVMALQSRVVSKIEKGELAGREITYRNVVRRMVPAGMWNGEANRVVLPKESLLPPDCDSCVALLQRGKLGKVVGVASLNQIA